MIEASVDCVITIDEESRILEFNAAAERTFGYRREKVVGTPLTEAIIPPALRESHLRGMAALKDGRASRLLGRRVEMRAMRADGSEFPVELTVTRIDSQSRPIFTAYLRDITEQKREEEKLRESERKYRELVELTHDLVWAVDTEGRFTYMSPASRRIYGREPQEMIGRLYTDFMSPEEASPAMAKLAEMIATGKSVYEVEARVYHRDGHEVILSANGVVQRDSAGNIVGITGISRDITQNKREEEKLRESETRFRELAENIREVFWMSDRENTRTIYISPGYETIWGRRRETLYASPASWMEAIHPEDKERMRHAITSRDSTKPHDSTYRIVRPDGGVRWIRDRGFPVRNEEGAVARFAGIAEDITERKQAEDRLREYEKVVEGLEEMIVVVDRDYRYLLANRAFLTSRGVERDQLIGRLVPDVLSPEAFATVADKLSDCLRGKTIQFEMRYSYPECGERDLLVSYFPIEGPSGIDRVACLLKDITERKRTEQARERGLSLMLATLESTADGIVVVNTEGKIETFNRLFARMWRLPEDVLASKEDARALEWVLDQLIEPKKFLEKVHYLYEHPEEESFDRLVFKDERVFERYSRPQLIGGKVAGRVWSFRDITERERTAQKLERNEKEQRQLAQQLAMEKARLVAAQAVAKVGSWETDARTGTVTWSAETHRIFETDPATFKPTHQLFLDVIHPEDRARVAEAFARGLALRSPCAVEHRLLMPDGRVKYLEERWQTFFDHEGEAIRAVGTCQDITERKQAHEEHRRVSRRLVDVQEEERRHLARELHDEIGQTLTAAKMNLESIDLPQSSAHVPRLEETITLLDNLLRQIRQISLDLHPSLLDDLGLVPALRSLLDQRASRAGLRAQLFAREALGRVDPGIQNTAFRIAQEAITNVLRHAKAQSIRLYLQHNRDQLRMKIVDDGIGFNPRRAGVKPVARENGFGLLSMRERAGLAGGRMEIVSAPNKGTSIEVVLPLNVPDEKP